MPCEFPGLNGWNVDHSPAFWMFETITRMFWPYQFNPFNFNPLREVLHPDRAPALSAPRILVNICALPYDAGYKHGPGKERQG